MTAVEIETLIDSIERGTYWETYGHNNHHRKHHFIEVNKYLGKTLVFVGDEH